MQTSEDTKLRKIEQRLFELRSRHRRLHAEWFKLNDARLQVEREMKGLYAERDALAQGQLLFPVAEDCLAREKTA